MGGYHNFYGGSSYGLKPDYGNPISNYIPASSITLGLDARTANQLREVSNKLNTGAGAVEVQMTMPEVAESIPDSHLEEMNRLRKLIGVDLTLHAPLVEPTGFNGRDNWDEQKRLQSERQLWNAFERAHKINPDGNVVVTVHASNGIPEPETRVWDKNFVNPDGTKGGEVVTNIAVVDERTGQIGQLPPASRDYLLQQEKNNKDGQRSELDKRNREIWLDSLSGLNLELQRAKEVLEGTFSQRAVTPEGRLVKMGGGEEEQNKTLELYKMHKEGRKEEFEKLAESLGRHPDFNEEKNKEIISSAKDKIENLERADIYIRHSFNQFKELYNRAYHAADSNTNGEKNETLKILNEIKNKISSEKEGMVDPKTGYLKDPAKLIKFADTLTESIQSMNSIKDQPKMFKPLKEFAIDKSAETFSSVALNAYKKFGDSAPIVSIENPPVGMGISRGQELKELVQQSRDKLQKKLVEEGLGNSEAEKQAEKLIGATWDVGHINMLRKYGYGDEQLKSEAGKIAKYVNKIHLSDNFGYEHTELPMGMGNVPMKAHLEELKKAHKEKLKQIKQVVETGHWYQHFQTSPFAETLSAFGSPIYGMQMAPYWNQASGNFAGYFAGQGLNPDIHHSLYGAGFSNLPVELGGQMQGKSRLSGAPIE